MSTCLWCAGDEQRCAAAHGQRANVGQVEAVHILVDGYGIQDALLVYVGRQRQLHQDAVDIGVSVVLGHHLAASKPFIHKALIHAQ